MKLFRLTRRAKSDLLSIGHYTQKEWGIAQRNQYLKEIDQRFYQIAETPEIGMECDEILAGYRKLSQGKHVIFYKMQSSNQILIVRILHQSMDTKQHF